MMLISFPLKFSTCSLLSPDQCCLATLQSNSEYSSQIEKTFIDLLFHHDVSDDRKELWTELVMKVSLIWEESISSRYIDLYGKRFSKEDHVSFVKIYLPFIVKGSIWRNTKISIHALNMLIGFVFIFQTS